MAQANPSPLHDLTAFQRDLITVIAGMDEPHGLAIKEELEEVYENVVHHGRLYPNLDDLVNKGLVDKSAIDRRTNAYSLTPRGRRELTSHQAWAEKAIDGGEA